MKKWIALLLALVMCLALCACGGGDNAAQQGDAAEAAPVTQGAKATDAQAAILEDDGLIALAERTFDLTQYSDSLTILDGIMDMTFTTVKVDGVELEYGMSFGDVLALGFRPDDPALGDANPRNTIKVAAFKTEDGKAVSLGFYGDGAIKNVGKLVIIGTYPYAASDAVAEVSVDDLTVGMTVDDLMQVYGAPDYLKKGVMGDELAIEMGYYSEDGNQKLKAYLGLDGTLVGFQMEDLG